MEAWMIATIAALASAVVIGTIFAILFYHIGYKNRQKKAEAEIGSAEEEAKRIRNEGLKIAETSKKEALISAKEEILKQRNEAEKEMKERRAEISRMERRLNQKEENLDKKTENLERKTEQLEEKLKANDALKADLEKKDDTNFIKALAREVLGLAEEGERIFYDVNE